MMTLPPHDTTTYLVEHDDNSILCVSNICVCVCYQKVDQEEGEGGDVKGVRGVSKYRPGNN